jgi:DNA-binding transcriptional MerR regulator
LAPARRAANGYRVFDESALNELAFISRAKGIGMSLEDIADLVASWPVGECRSLQARLRAYLAGRISQVRQQTCSSGNSRLCSTGCRPAIPAPSTAGGDASARPIST